MKNVLLYKQNSTTPFVWKEGDKFYIERVEYIDDITLLLDAISEVHEVQYNELSTKCQSKEEHWKLHFNYQWSGGSLILWQNPTELWEQDCARRGTLYCLKCENKKFMYYRPLCPECDRPEPNKNGSIDLIHACKYLEHKNKLEDESLFQWIAERYRFSNDTFISLENPDLVETDIRTALDLEYLEIINKEFPIETTLFLISW